MAGLANSTKFAQMQHGRKVRTSRFKLSKSLKHTADSYTTAGAAAASPPPRQQQRSSSTGGVRRKKTRHQQQRSTGSAAGGGYKVPQNIHGGTDKGALTAARAHIVVS
jgi:hypothetical protein